MAARASARFDSLRIQRPEDLLFGVCPQPVSAGGVWTAQTGTSATRECSSSAGGVEFGAGEVIPELNYALPYGTEVSESTTGTVEKLYHEMASKALQRAVELGIQKLVIEIELVFEQTLNPAWGEGVIKATRDAIEEYRSKGVTAVLRATVADIRDRTRPPRNRTGAETQLVLESLERCAPWSDILSIESTGGKEVSDDAIMYCDPLGVVFAVGALGSRDMEFLWRHVVDIAGRHGKVAGGDAACGFANTAMQLARNRMIPTVFAAMVRAVGAARSLVAFEQGATGPDKDCAYEGPVMKAIAGVPIAMEGKSAACAHSTHLGNVAMACCDLWSNESVPYARLFGGSTPEVMLEQLWYDCKMLNAATRCGTAREVQQALVESDIHTSAEALVLAPVSAIRIAESIVSSEDYGERALRAALEAIGIIEDALAAGALKIPEQETDWLVRLRGALDPFAGQPDALVEAGLAQYGPAFLPEEYGLA